jgi:hypothetical protein
MRLSNNQKILIHLFLITSLTLLLKPNANAQAQSDKVFAYNDYGHNRHSFNEPKDNSIYVRTDIGKHDAEATDAQLLPTIDFHRTSENFYSKPPAYHLIKNRKAYLAHNLMPRMVYSVELKHSARLTFKLFKLVIVPLWQSK